MTKNNQNRNTKRSGGDLVEHITSLMPLRRFGWSFLLAWVFCVFYTEVVDGYIGDTTTWLPANGLLELFFFTGFPVLTSVIMLIIIVCSENRFGSPTDHPVLFLVAPAATALSTPLLFWLTGSPSVTFVMFVVGSILTGFGSGFMWVMWGEFFSKTSQGDAEFLAPISAIVAALLVLLVSAMDGWVALAFVTTLPLISGLCFYLSWKDVQDHAATAEHLDISGQQAFKDARDRAKGSLVRVLGSMGRVGFGILVACLFVCLLGTFSAGLDKHSLPFQMMLIASIVFMVVVSFASTLGPRRISISFLYRWMCPVLVTGFVSLIVFDANVGGYVALMVSVAARFAFCVITQMYFARYAATGEATAVQSYGLGWIFVHLGDFLGVMLFVGLSIPLKDGSFSIDQIAAVSIAVLVGATMFVLNDRKSFSSERVQNEEGSAAQLQPDLLEGVLPDEFLDRMQTLAAQFELTPRETEVFELLARGRSIPYVRDALVISKETAATHAKHIYAKLGVHSRQELIDLMH